MEVWKEIEGTGGRYEVSNTGKVRSLNYKRTGMVRELKPSPDPKGYMKTMLLYGGKFKTVKIHRIAAETFIPNPEGKPQVNHIDGNKKNNGVDNLEWITNIDNAHHAIKKGLFVNSYKATAIANNKRKKPITAIDEEGNKIEFESLSEASRQLKAGRRHIQQVLKGERKQTGGYKFMYREKAVIP